jgi:hypothetical protein
MMHMDVQERRLRCIHAAAQRRLDKVDIVKTFCAVQVDDQVHAGTSHAVAQSKMIVTLADRYDHRSGYRHGHRLSSGSAWIAQTLI